MHSKLVAGALLAGLGIAVAASAGRADDRKDVKGLDVLFKATAMKGLPVTNSPKQDLGKIEDIVLNKDGHINYLVVGYGGTLGVGEKVFAIPYGAFLIRDGKDGKAGHFFADLGDVDRVNFDKGPGFDKKAYPTKGDEGFLKLTGRPIQAAVETVKERARDATKGEEKDEICRTSKMHNAMVKNDKGEDLGRIHDMMIHTTNGKVAYVVVGHGGVGGVGDKLFAVDWNALHSKHLSGKPEEVSIVWNMDKATLDNNPGFNKEAWPTEADKNLTRK
jgi:sporulation protein YlmC with PRC-barrel domain